MGSEPEIPWEPVGERSQTAELQLSDLDLLADLTHPVRGRIVRNLDRPRSAAELAERLDVPLTRLYHHLNRLEQVELIFVQATRRVGSATQHRYQSVAQSFSLKPELYDELDGAELAQALGSLFDVAKIRMQRVLEAVPPQRPSDNEALLSLGELRLTRDEFIELVARLRTVVDEATERSRLVETDGDEPTFTLFVAAFPDQNTH